MYNQLVIFPLMATPSPLFESKRAVIYLAGTVFWYIAQIFYFFVLGRIGFLAVFPFAVLKRTATNYSHDIKNPRPSTLKPEAITTGPRPL